MNVYFYEFIPETWSDRWGTDEENSQIFSSRRPRDLGAGLSSGLKNAAKGVGLGAAALIAAPAYGASQVIKDCVKYN